MELIELVRNDIKSFLTYNRELLFNERDFQMRLSLSLLASKHYDDVDLEYHLPIGQKPSFDREYERWETEKPSIDIVVRRGEDYIPIELKYKLKAISGRISRFGEKSPEDVPIVTNQAAQNLGRYAFWKDVRRIELVKKHYRAVNAGIAVFLTNDESYLKSRVGTNYYDFSMDEGRQVSGVLDWKVPNNNYPSIPLDGTYVIRWGKTSFHELMKTAYYARVTI